MIATETESSCRSAVILPWFALRVKSRCEEITARALERKGYECFSPTYQIRRRWSDRQKQVDLPLFPGYVFCRLDPERRLPVLMTPGVAHVVGMGRTPVALEESEIEAIQAVVRSGLAAQPWPYQAIGKKVRIEHGSMRGLEGLLVSVKSEARLVLSVHLLQRSVAVEIDADLVQAVA